MDSDLLGPTPPSKMTLFQHRSRHTSHRTIGKIALLVVTCTVFGYTASQLYVSQEIPQTIQSYSGPSRVVLTADGRLVDEGNSGPKEYLPPNSPLRFKPETAPQHRTAPQAVSHGLHEKLSSSISAFNTWRKGSSALPPQTWSEDRQNKTTNVPAITAKVPASTYREVDEEVFTPSDTTVKRPVVGKVTIITGGDNDIYERALRTHEAHNKMHGYPLHALRQSILNDVWSKPAYILSVLLRELAKPKAERLQWLFWVDADTIILNPHVPAELFLPPAEWNEVHMLVSHDYNGLNNGVFPLRVHPWSVELLTAVLAYPHYKPDSFLLFRDQSAMAELLETPKFKKHTLLAPQRWFNAYQGEVNETIAPFQVRHGDLLVHFAGVPERDTRMQHWLRRAEEHSDEWEVELRYTSYRSEIKDFWDDMGAQRSERIRALQDMRQKADVLLELRESEFNKFKDRLVEAEASEVEAGIGKLRKVMNDEATKDDAESIHAAMDNLEELATPLRVLAGKIKKVLVKEAHDAIFAAERTTFINQASHKVEKESKEIDAVSVMLKDKLVEEPFNNDQVRYFIDELRIKHKDLLEKVNVAVAEEEAASTQVDAAERPAVTEYHTEDVLYEDFEDVGGDLDNAELGLETSPAEG